MTAAMDLHVALSLRLDATEAYRLAHAYLAESLRKEATNLRCVEREETPEGALGTRTGLLRAALILDERADLIADLIEAGTSSTELDAARQAALLDAIRTDPSGRWKSGRAVEALRRIGHHPVSPGSASHYLAALAAAGHLIRHDEEGVRWYEVARRRTQTPASTIREDGRA